MSAIPPSAHVIIIGAMKAGTSFLYSLLGQHPALCRCRIKEPEFFSQNQIHGLRPKEKQNLRYEDLWDFDPAVHRYALETSTGYSKFPREQGVPERMARYGIVPVLIYVVRNPFDRIESQYNFAHSTGKVDRKLSITDDRYVNFSKYHLQLSQYREYFSRENLVIVDFDELVQRPQQAVDGLCTRLQLSPVTIDLSTADRNATPPGGHCLTAGERTVIHGKLREDMHGFRRDYDFPVEKWGF